MAEPSSIDAEGNIAVSFHRVAVAIKLKVHLPELITAVTTEGTKHREQSHTRAKTHLAEGVSGTERTQNVGGDQVEHRGPDQGLIDQHDNY